MGEDHAGDILFGLTNKKLARRWLNYMELRTGLNPRPGPAIKHMCEISAVVRKVYEEKARAKDLLNKE